MILTILLFLAALSLATAAGFFSVVGLAITYGGAFWSIVALGSTIEFGKLVAVSFLYRFWDKINWALKSLLFVMIIGVMAVTSLGVFGYLTKSNQVDMVGLKQTIVAQDLLEQELERLTARKNEIDAQIAGLPSNFVNARIRLQREFDGELKAINERIPQITLEKAQLASQQITQQADIGPLVFIARTLGRDVDVATTWFTILLVIVFDPLAVLLTICGNIAYIHHQRRPVKVVLEDKPEPSVEVGSSYTTIDEDLGKELEEWFDRQGVLAGKRTTIDPIVEPLPEVQPTTVDIPAEPDPEPSVVPREEAIASTEEVILPPIPDPSTPAEPEKPCQLSDDDKKLAQTDWGHFYNKKLTHPASSVEFEEKIEQLKAYVAELDQRGAELSVDEVILRDRIVNFIKRHEK
jgi:hypothetical protein